MQSDFKLNIKSAFDKEDIEIPFPQTDLYIKEIAGNKNNSDTTPS